MKEKLPSRRSIRLINYDYSQANSYFVTICTQNRDCLFGDVVNKKVVLNDVGKMVEDEWLKSAIIRKEIQLDEYVIMPNHIHGIANITVGAHGVRPSNGMKDSGAHRAPLRKLRSLSSFIAGFKASTTSQIRRVTGQNDYKLWQRNYYEHIIRDEKDYFRIQEYIHLNPAQWEFDRENPFSI